MNLVDLNQAIAIIKAGEIVAIPTETVYGLAADAENDYAVAKIFTAKGRPQNNPLITHFASLEQARKYAKFNEAAEKLSKLWPGPLTMVLERQDHCNLAKSISAQHNSLAVRVPSHPLALALIRQAGVPIAAPSANVSNKLSPTCASHVARSFQDSLPLLPILYRAEADEQSTYGLESTIVDLTTKYVRILRPGYITAELISDILGINVEYANSSVGILAPGMMKKHYSPVSPMRINAVEIKANEAILAFGEHAVNGAFVLNLSPTASLAEAAKNLFAYLHRLDEYAIKNNTNIAVMPIPNENIGIAINDRLKRAAHK